jgi:DNA-binding transcriptional ArsR family regulator
MRSKAPPLLPILRSRAQGEVLACLFVDPRREWSLSDLSRHLGLPLTSVQSEADRLIEAGILTSRKLGRNRLVRANEDHPQAGPLSLLILSTFGPPVIIAEEFSACTPAHLIIFGSWAARLHGAVGRAPADIDVLVVGDDLDRACIYAAAERAETRLSLPVNPVARSLRAWKDPASDPLIGDIVSKPLVNIDDLFYSPKA